MSNGQRGSGRGRSGLIEGEGEVRGFVHGRELLTEERELGSGCWVGFGEIGEVRGGSIRRRGRGRRLNGRSRRRVRIVPSRRSFQEFKGGESDGRCSIGSFGPFESLGGWEIELEI